MLRIALAQANATVGDLEGNAALVVQLTRRAAAAGASLVAFPEMFLTGYPIEDLALRESFIDASTDALAQLVATLADSDVGDITVVVGYLDRQESSTQTVGQPRHHPRNAVAVAREGQVIGRYYKHHLPNYGVFDEFRYFVPGDSPCQFEVDGHRVAVAICEDLWQDGGPIAWARRDRADLVVVVNGSPYERNKDDVRLELAQRRAAEAGCVLAYVNLVGGQDELVFDGDSLVVAADGEVVARAGQFVDDLLVVDVAPVPSGTSAPRLDDEAEVYAALVLGLRDYVHKNGFTDVVLGLSGGIDSALTAALAVDALGADHVHGVAMPSAYSSEHSKDDAADLARRTGVAFRTVEIEPVVQAYQAQLRLMGLAEENLQARVRGTTLMGISNAEGPLVLATGNKSELSVGYSTLYGDAVGGYAPLKDVPKTLVWALSRWRNDAAVERGETPPIPPNSITKPPSAELSPGQLDTDSLPEYQVLDDVLDDYVETDASADDLVARGFDVALVERILRLTDVAEYKRRQYPPGPKISLRAFGRDRRLPMTNAWRERSHRHG
ncbi:MAG: NAD+ synthase [Actinomycetes bacterium]